MLRNTSEMAKDAINKSLIIPKIFLKKIFEFLLRHQIFVLRTMLLLMPLLDHCYIKKQSGKKDLT